MTLLGMEAQIHNLGDGAAGRETNFLLVTFTLGYTPLPELICSRKARRYLEKEHGETLYGHNYIINYSSGGTKIEKFFP